MKLTAGRNRRARTWLLCGLLACAGFAFFGGQYARAVRQARLDQNLLAAISSQQAAAVQSLLRAGANPNARLFPDTPPPWQTLVATIRRLWRHQRSAPRPAYPTALVVAIGTNNQASKPQVQIIQSLLDAGANPNTAGLLPLDGTDSDTPLVWAVRQGNPQIVRLLLDRHANPRTGSHYGEPCLSLAAQSDHSNTQIIAVMLLARGVDVNERDAYGQTPLMVAVTSGVDSAVIKLLLDCGANISARDPGGETALFKSIQNYDSDKPDNLPVVTLLLNAGADVNAKGVSGDSALYYSVGTKVFPLLLSRGAKIFTPHDPNGTWLMHHACDSCCDLFSENKGDYSVIETLLARGVSINSRDWEGVTPLLVAAGLDVDKEDSQQKSPITTQLMAYLLRHGASVDARNGLGRTPLIIASEASPKADLLLLAHGANVNARDKDGRTPLMCAVAKGKVDTARALLAHGADRRVRDNKGLTALDRARAGRFDPNTPFNSPMLEREFTQLFEQYP